MTPATATKANSPHPPCDKAVDSGGLRYGAMESALRPPLPTATQSDRHQPDRLLNLRRPKSMPANRGRLDQTSKAKHHHFDPRKHTPGGRHQIGTPAGFKSESVAGFLLECVAGFVGIRRRVWRCISNI